MPKPRSGTVLAVVALLVVVAGWVAWRFADDDAGTATVSRGRDAAGPQSPSSSAAARPSTPPAVTPHLMIIVEENHSSSQVIGNSSMPFFNRLARDYGLATDYTGVSHPSEPNYLAMISGSIWDNPQDRPPQDDAYKGPTLVDQLAARGIGWKAYIEDMPGACDRSDTYGPGRYDVNHNPFMYFASVRDSGVQCSKDVPFAQFGPDLSSGSAPPFIFVAPNTLHDMHDGTPAQGDAWLKQQFGLIMASDWYRHGGVVVVTFDEGETSEQVPTLVVGQATLGIAALRTPVNHFGLLRGIEERYGLPLLGSAGDPRNGDLSPLLHP
jgi:acid phosphatase